MMLPTDRKQNNSRMAEDEKRDYIKIIKTMPWLYEPILKELEENIGDAKSLLDVACGDGYLLYLISKKFPNLKLTGIDIDEYFIKHAKAKYPFEFRVEDAYLFEGSADIVICNLALHHFERPSDLIERMYDHSKKIVIISDQLRPPYDAELNERLFKRKNFITVDFDYYSKNERSSILEAYSKVEILNIFKKTNLDFKLRFVDADYYERYVAVCTK